MKTVTIEELLMWAFVHELPKGGGVDGLANANSAWRMLQASSWGKVTAFAELMTLVDTGPAGGDNFFIEQGAPHDDALEVGGAVAALVSCDAVIPPAWQPLADWEADAVSRPLVEDATARAIERFGLRPRARRGAHLVSLIVGTAVLGKRPDYSAERPKTRMVERGGKPAWFVKRMMRDSFGREIEIETTGYSGRSHRPVRGSYRKYEFSHDPVGDIMGRMDWQLWVAALNRLEAGLAGKLIAHRLAPHGLTPAPWCASSAGPAIGLADGVSKQTRTAI